MKTLAGCPTKAYDHSGETVTVYLKRNRKLINKMELTRLQRNFESCMQEIQRMEVAVPKADDHVAL